MAQPTPYDRQFSFASYQALHPSDPLPGDEVDAELNAVKASLDETQSNLALIQRDDGQLANGSVGPDQLSSEITVGLTPAIMWATNLDLEQNQSVFYNLILYRTLAACNTGAVFNAAQFVELADLTSIANPGGGIGTAQLLDGAVTAPKIAAGAVTPAKMTGFTAQRLIGRYSATAGDLQTISIGGQLSLSGAGVLNLAPDPTFGAVTVDSLAASGAISTSAGDISAPAGAVIDRKGDVRTIGYGGVQSEYQVVTGNNGQFIVANGNVGMGAGVFTKGQNVLIYNNTAGDIVIGQGSGVTLILVGVGTTGTRTIAKNGLATILALNDAETFAVAGTGVS